MSPELLAEKTRRFQELTGATERVGISEFARTKTWRNKLQDAGCFEVVDRSGLIGYMLTPDYATAISNHISELEKQLEQMQIAAMFRTREDYTHIKTGRELTAGALDYFDKNVDKLMDVVDGN